VTLVLGSLLVCRDQKKMSGRKKISSASSEGKGPQKTVLKKGGLSKVKINFREGRGGGEILQNACGKGKHASQKKIFGDCREGDS